MEFEQVAQVLKDHGLIGKIKHAKAIDFRFIALLSRVADSSGRTTVPAKPPLIIYVHGKHCIVSIDVGGILTIHHDLTVIVRTILDCWDMYDQLRDYPLYRAMQAIKQTGHAALFEDRAIFIYKLEDAKETVDTYLIDEQIEAIGNFDKKNSCAAFQFQDKFWTYKSSAANTEQTKLTLEQCVELFKSQLGKKG